MFDSAAIATAKVTLAIWQPSCFKQLSVASSCYCKALGGEWAGEGAAYSSSVAAVAAFETWRFSKVNELGCSIFFVSSTHKPTSPANPCFAVHTLTAIALPRFAQTQ